MICPTCRKPVDPRGEHAATKPFCSETCRDIDLVRWLDGKYAIPGDPVESVGLSGDEEEEER